MKRKHFLSVFIFCIGLICIHPLVSIAQSTAFTYQGQLKDGGNPANGSYDLRFVLNDAESGDTQVGSTVYVYDKDVANGLFTAELEFGAQTFVYSGGADYWIEIGVREGSVSNTILKGYTALSPRQKISPTPYSLFSQNADMLDGRVVSDFMASNVDIWVNTTGDNMTGPLVVSGSNTGDNMLKATNTAASGYAGSFIGSGTNTRGLYAYSSGTNTWALESFAEGEGASVGGRFDAAGGNNSKAVEGIADNAGAFTNYGGYFRAAGNYGEGVYAQSTGIYGTGVHGVANGNNGKGGSFSSSGTDGRGVYAYTSSPNAWALEAFAEGTGASIGGRFDAAGGNNSKAVEGIAGNNGAFTNYGGYFRADGASAQAIYGQVSGASAKALVAGHTNNNYAHLGTSQYAGYFNGPTKFNGNIDGDLVVTGNYKYSAAKNFIKHYPAHSFGPMNTKDPDKYLIHPSGYSYLIYGTEESELSYELGTNVELPHGAKITEVAIFVYDNDSVCDLNYDVHLKRRYFGNLAGTNVASIIGATSGENSNMINPYTTTISDPVIDNNLYVYYLSCLFQNSNTYYYTPQLRFYGVRIKYEMTTVAP